MNRMMTFADIQDVYLHSKWSSFKAILRALRIAGKERVLTRWNNVSHLSINWYDLPYVVKYAEKNMTGDENTSYAKYLLDKYFQGRDKIRILSPGCGIGVKEFQFAKHPSVGRIDAFDLAPIRIEEAKRRAAKMGFSNVNFYVGNIYKLDIGEKYDIVLFDGCLHHFDGLDGLMDQVISFLKPGGLLVIVEYTGPTRYQYTREHLEKCNEALKLIPESHRTFLQSSVVKKKVWAPGYIRMILSDPSEGVQSGEILPAIHRKFKILEEKKIGGDLLAPVLKGTVHHYLRDDASNPILDLLFAFESEYLAKLPAANHTFGIYSPKAASGKVAAPPVSVAAIAAGVA